MEDRINALRQYMDLFRQTVGRDLIANNNRPGFNPTHYNVDGMALDFAKSMIQPEMPDFGQETGPSYVAPKPIDRIAGEAGFPIARPPAMQRPESTQSGMAMNYLRNLFRGR